MGLARLHPDSCFIFLCFPAFPPSPPRILARLLRGLGICFPLPSFLLFSHKFRAGFALGCSGRIWIFPLPAPSRPSRASSPAIPMEHPAAFGDRNPPGMLEKAGIGVLSSISCTSRGSALRGILIPGHRSNKSWSSGALYFPSCGSTLVFLGTKSLDLRPRQARIPRKRGGSCSQWQLRVVFQQRGEKIPILGKITILGIFEGFFWPSRRCRSGLGLEGDFLGKMLGWMDFLHGGGWGQPKLRSFGL